MTTACDVVAIVDDDEYLLGAMRRLLTVCGYDVETFVSAEDYLAAVSTSAAACVIIDVDLGPSSGLELGHRLAERGFDTPVVFITALQNPIIEERAKELGCAAFLRKPFQADALLDAVKAGIAAGKRR